MIWLLGYLVCVFLSIFACYKGCIASKETLKTFLSFVFFSFIPVVNIFFIVMAISVFIGEDERMQNFLNKKLEDL